MGLVVSCPLGCFGPAPPPLCCFGCTTCTFVVSVPPSIPKLCWSLFSCLLGPVLSRPQIPNQPCPVGINSSSPCEQSTRSRPVSIWPQPAVPFQLSFGPCVVKATNPKNPTSPVGINSNSPCEQLARSRPGPTHPVSIWPQPALGQPAL